MLPVVKTVPVSATLDHSDRKFLKQKQNLKLYGKHSRQLASCGENLPFVLPGRRKGRVGEASRQVCSGAPRPCSFPLSLTGSSRA